MSSRRGATQNKKKSSGRSKGQGKAGRRLSLVKSNEPAEAPLIFVLSGPNLDRLGQREPEIYGSTTLEEVHTQLEQLAAALGVRVECRQSNHEGTLVDWFGEAQDADATGVLINAGAYTHTSYALYDAINASDLPTVEVHVSNPEARESFRHESRIAAACIAKVAGFGAASYTVALRALSEWLEHN